MRFDVRRAQGCRGDIMSVDAVLETIDSELLARAAARAAADLADPYQHSLEAGGSAPDGCVRCGGDHSGPQDRSGLRQAQSL